MTSQVHELFGYRLKDSSETAKRVRRECLCPFMGQECDGGGNRYQSFPKLQKGRDDDLIRLFRREKVPAGVCSLFTGGETWVVCPRRLFTMDHGGTETSHERFCRELLQVKFGIPRGRRAGIWSEVKLKYADPVAASTEDEKYFDYTFDYIVIELGKAKLHDVAKRLGITERKAKKMAEEQGFVLASRSGVLYIDDYPMGVPYIVEVMTSSTSGGNKAKGTTIEEAFKKAVRGQEHQAPGINYRQVWARMVSQLIVKSQIGKEWGGRTLWILQDALAHYISRTTDLNLRKLVSTALREVNILSLKYSSRKANDGTVALEQEHLFAGVIPPITGDTDFNKLLQAASIPPREELERKLLGKQPRLKFEVT
jgi:hypothetical protein